MRVAIVYYYEGQNSDKQKNISEAISRGLERQNIQADIINGRTEEDKKLTIYDLIVLISSPISSFSSKLPSNLTRYLENCGKISGKRCWCILTGGLLFKNKALQNLMKIAESEGIIIKTSEVINKADYAEAFALHNSL